MSSILKPLALAVAALPPVMMAGEALADTQTFFKPKQAGNRLDWCLDWSTGCGVGCGKGVGTGVDVGMGVGNGGAWITGTFSVLNA